MTTKRLLIAMVGLAFVIAIAAMAGTAANAAIGAQGLPSTSTGDPSGPLTILGVALTGIGVVLLRGRSVRHL